MRVLTADQMREADAAAVERIGEVALMRAAGEAIAATLRTIAPNARRIVAFAGPGNNGGDAFAALAELGGPSQRIVYAMPARDPGVGRRDAQRRATASGVVTRPFPLTTQEAIHALDRADVAIDALLGTGAHAMLSPVFESAVAALNTTSAHVLAVDIPTGIDATNGHAHPHAVRAQSTVTLGAVKIGLLLDPARRNCGDLFLGDIGIDEEIAAVASPTFRAIDAIEFAELLPKRADDSDKRSSGAPLVIAGSGQFPGAAVLCARGAARTGAGYVTVACPENAAATLRAHLVEQDVVTYDERDVGGSIDVLAGLMRHASAVAIGPGLGLSDAMGEIVRGFLARVDRPFVADAGALFHLAKHLDLLHGKTCVLTPHEGEFARLSGEGTIPPGRRIERLESFVARTGIVTLLKGNTTLVSDGTMMHLNISGTSALATAGTGDVLSGIIATLLSQGLAPVDAARAAAYWHGLAGRYAARQRPIGVVAGDVADALGAALPIAPAPLAARLRRLI